MMIDRIDSALSMLRTDLVQRFTQGNWDAGEVEQAARAVMACLQTESEEPDRDTPAPHSKLGADALRRALRYIDDNLDAKLTWQDIAAHIGVEAFGFGRRFRASTGMTPHQYVIRCRVRQAMKLLEQDELSIAEIALEVGCTCQSHLTTLFRKYTGTTPGAFRRAALSRDPGHSACGPCADDAFRSDARTTGLRRPYPANGETAHARV